MNRENMIKTRWAGCRLLPVLMLLALVGCGGGGNNLSAQPAVPTQQVAIDVQSALVTPVYTLTSTILPGGFPLSEYNDGNFVLRSNTEVDDVAVLGSSHDPSPAAVRVVLGTYDVEYQHETGVDVPQNKDTVVQNGSLVNSNQAPFGVAMTAWAVTPSFQQNSASFPSSEYDDGVFYLQPVLGGERIFLGNSHTVSPDPVQVLAGSYNVVYELETGGDLVPGNQNAVVDTLNVSTDISPTINLASVRFQFDATLDTNDFPLSQYQHAKFFLRNSAGDRIELGASYDLAVGLPPITQMVVEGTYDIVYQYVQGDALPVNTDAVIAKDVVIGTGGVSSVTVDIQTVAITPAFALDGNPFPQSEYNDANFYLRSANNPNDVMFIGASEVTPLSVRVIDSDFDTDTGGGGILFGAYDVLYRHETGKDVPQNANAVVRSNVVVNADISPFNVAVQSVDVTGTFSLNGNSFPANASDSVQFLLRDSADDSDTFLFGFSDVANEPVKVFPKSYHVVMDHLDGDAVPQNEMHEVDFNIPLNNGSPTLSVNVQAIRVAPNFTLDNMAFPASFYQRARFHLRERHAPFNLIFLGESYKDNTPVMVIKEDYDAIYEHISGEQVPQNTNSNAGLVDL